jgi:hypothetical protein
MDAVKPTNQIATRSRVLLIVPLHPALIDWLAHHISVRAQRRNSQEVSAIDRKRCSQHSCTNGEVAARDPSGLRADGRSVGECSRVNSKCIALSRLRFHSIHVQSRCVLPRFTIASRRGVVRSQQLHGVVETRMRSSYPDVDEARSSGRKIRDHPAIVESRFT